MLIYNKNWIVYLWGDAGIENANGSTMKLFTVSFFGHRIVPEFREAEERVEALIHTLLLENEYVEFLVGRNGDFDQIVTSAVKRQQRRVRDDNSALIWIPQDICSYLFAKFIRPACAAVLPLSLLPLGLCRECLPRK